MSMLLNTLAPLIPISTFRVRKGIYLADTRSLAIIIEYELHANLHCKDKKGRGESGEDGKKIVLSPI